MNFYIFNNGIMTEDAMSGCEQRVLNWLPLFSEKAESVTIITSKQGSKRFRRFNHVKVVETTEFIRHGLAGLFISYIVRAVKGCLVQRFIPINAKGKNIIYSASDLIPDFIPALFLKLKNKDAHLIVGLHLIAPLPWKGFRKYYLKGFSLPTASGVYYFVSQSIMLFIARRYASLVLVSNHYDRKIILRKGFGPEKVLAAYGGIRREEIDEIKSDKISYEACYVGRFHPQKGFTDLIDIWHKVVKKFPQARLIVIGYDINLGRMKEKVKKSGLENNICFQGFVGGKDKFRLIKSSKIALVPSYYESFGMVILEALACGVPVVSYRLPLYKDIYTQGIKTVDIGEKDKFADSIISLLENEDERQKLGQAGESLSREFKWERTAQDILSCLEKLN